jgi:uncharacterized membrane protein
MQTPDPPVQFGRNIGFERLVFFSDAVFAIAITLLALDLKSPQEGPGSFALASLLPNAIGFALSFFVVGRYWLAHHELFEGLVTYDGRLLSMNLYFLGGIAFLPFPTSVVAIAKPDSGPVIFYTLSMAAVGLLLITLALVARRPALTRPGETRGGTVKVIVGMTGSPIVFIASACVAIDYPQHALYVLILLLPVGWASDRLGLALQRKIDAPVTGLP